MDWSLYPNFSPKEFTCKCGCGRVDMDEEFMAFLQDIRSDIGRKFTITSGYRCPAYEKNIGGSGKNHPTGKAADIVAERSVMSRIVARSEAYGFTGVGVSLSGDGNFIHLDTSHKDLTVWSY